MTGCVAWGEVLAWATAMLVRGRIRTRARRAGVTGDPITTLRETLEGACISAECRAVGATEHEECWRLRQEAYAALAQVEALAEAAQAVLANQILVRYDNAADPMFDLRDALVPFAARENTP